MNTEKQKTLVVVDGNSLMFRAYYATSYTGNLMQTSTGIYTNALFGFINMFNKLLEVTKPDYIMVAFDKGKKTFRHLAYDDYKGTRKHMPEELAMQIDLIKEYLDIMQIKRLELDVKIATFHSIGNTIIKENEPVRHRIVSTGYMYDRIREY